MKLNLIAASALLAFAGVSQAADYDLGALMPPDALGGLSAKFAKNALISDNWTFQLLANASASADASRTFSVASGGIVDFAASLSGGTLAAPVVFAPSSTASSQSLDWLGALGAGDYTLHVSGMSNLANTKYSVLVDVTPVPEPETYALMLAGLAAVGFVARRRAPKA